MTDQDQPSPLGERALQRLRKLADGNGLSPDDIRLYSVEAKTYAIEGVMTFTLMFETRSARYPGGVPQRQSAHGRQPRRLQPELDRLKQEFPAGHGWIAKAAAAIKEQPAEGWGLDDVRVPLPDQSRTLAASEACSTCQGNKALTCQQCQGVGSHLPAVPGKSPGVLPYLRGQRL